MTRIDVDILVISLNSPLLVGVYHKDKLIKKYIKNEKTSDILPIIFENIIKNYTIKGLFFANGPGSFMAIKVTYLFLKTLSITKQIPIFCADGFYFNQNSPIKASGNRFFMKKNGNINIKKLENLDGLIKPFELPSILNKKIFKSKVEPLYVLPAV